MRAAALLALAALLLCGAASGAEPEAPERVGDWGQPERLTFEGNRAYGRDDIVKGLNYRLDFHLAAHPAAPLTHYLDALQQMVRAGYQRCGFPDVTVATRLDAQARHIVVRINEGPRYTCGDVFITGKTTLTNEAARTTILQAITASTKNSGGTTNGPAADWATWTAGSPAPFDEAAPGELTGRIQGALAEAGCFNARFHLKLAPDPARQQAVLRIEIEDEGLRGVIEEFEVTGNQTNSREQVLTFLGLKPGIEAKGALVEDLKDRLWKSARFLKHDVSLSPLAEPGKLKLSVDLRELKEAPPLDQEFPMTTKGWLKLCDWLSDLDNHAEDLACSIQIAPALANQLIGEAVFPEIGILTGELVFSASGMTFLCRSTQSNQPPALRYAVVGSSRLLGLYSGARRHKLTFDRKTGQVNFYVEAVGVPDAVSDETSRLNFGAGFSSDDSGQPFRLTIKLAPVVFARLAATLNQTSVLEQGILTIKVRNPDLISDVQIKLDPATGRLIEANFGTPEFSVRLRSEAGAFARTVQDIAAATATYRNDAVEGKYISASVAFIASDLVRGMSLVPTAPPADWNRLAALVERIEPGKWFTPLDGLDWWAFGRCNCETFFDIPLGAGVSSNQVEVLASENRNDPYAGFRRLLLVNADALWPRGSWPWTLLRETVFACAGRSDYTPTELQRLSQSNDLGPLSCLAGMDLAVKVNPQLAEAFAARASLISPTGLQNDWRQLLQKESRMGQVLENALKSLGALSQEEVDAVAALLSPNEADFFRSVAKLVRAAPDQPAAETLWPAVEQHWEKVFKPRLAAAFGASQ